AIHCRPVGAGDRGSRKGTRAGCIETGPGPDRHARARGADRRNAGGSSAAAGWNAHQADGTPSPWSRRVSPVITVVLVDDHHLVRRGLRRLLEDDPEIAVVGEAADGDEAIRLVADLDPRVVVMDAAMRGTSGLSATRSILASK